MTQPQRSQPAKRSNVKPLLNTLKVTTAIGAVSLTLAGWGVLSRVEATNAAQAALDSPAEFASAASTAVSFPASSSSGFAPRASSAATSTNTAIARPAPTETTSPTAMPTPTIEAAGNGSAGAATTQVKLDVVQWVQTNAGDSVAVVRDGRGVLWYVWGTDVPLIEQGLSPQYQPVPVNSQGRSRNS